MLNTIKILLIEDDLNDVKLIERQLKKDGLSVEITQVDSRENMISYLDANHPDVVIADYILPRFTGLEALHIFKHYNLNIPFITLTGTGAEDIAVEMMKEGSDDYVIKTHLRRLAQSVLANIEKHQSKLEKKRQREILKESERAYKLLADNSKDIISRHKVTGEFIYASPAIYEITGYKPEEVLGVQLRRFLHPNDVLEFRNNLDSMLQNKKEMQTEIRFRKKNGSYVWLETSGRGIQDEKTKSIYEIVAVTRDASLRKLTEESLMLSEERYRIIAETASDVILTINDNNEILFVNPAIYKVFGYKPEELTGKSITNLIPEMYREKHKEGMSQYLSTGIKMVMETFGLHKTGREFAIEISLGHSTIGKSLLVSAIIRDIDERQKVQQMLIESSNRLSLIYNTSSDLMFLLSVEPNEVYRYVSVNKSYREASGIKEDEIIGKKIGDLIHESKLTENLKKIKLAIESENPVRFEEKSYLKGMWMVLETTYTAIFDTEGNCTNILGSSSDITEEKKAMALLTQSENRYRLLAENATDMITKHDLDGYYYYVSMASYPLLGYAPEDLIGKSAYDFLHPDDYESIKNGINTFLQLGLGVYTGSYRYKRKDGSYVWIESTNKIVYKEGTDDIEGIIAVSRDITERKKFESKLEDKIKELDTFIYRSSHDLKGPLASLLGLVNIAKLELTETGSLEYIGLIERSVRHLDNILMDLLNITRITQGRMKNSKIDFQDIIQNTLRSFENLPEFEKVHVEVEVSQLTNLYYDKTLLNNILHNLIINALKYKDVKKKYNHIKIEVRETDDTITICIEDNGEGIPESMQKNVFEMFFRGNTKSSGTGLGLYIVKNAVDKLNGIINLESKEGIGTTFKIILPLIGKEVTNLDLNN